MKALMILENGFEDTEGLTTYDVLKRAGFEIDAASLNTKEISTQSGHMMHTKYVLSEIINNINIYDFLILPGGRAVSQVLSKSKEIEDLIDLFYNNKKMICAICAAPLLIGRKGYFENLTYTCFPGCEETITKGKKGKDGVIVNDYFITATSMYYSIDFALAIVEKFLGKEKKKKVQNSLMGK